MTDDSGKRIAIRFCTVEAITTIEDLPRGYKSMIVEYAFNSYLDSIPGQKLLEQLKKRKKQHNRIQVSSQPKESTPKTTLRQKETTVFEKLIGDF